MKKVIVLTLTALFILALAVMGASARQVFGMSADALGGDRAYAPSVQVTPGAPPPMEQPMAMAEMDKKDAPRKMSKLLGAKGGGGYGSGMAALGGRGDLAAGLAPPSPKPSPAASAEAEEQPRLEGGAAPAATRAWFPETFLFEPLVLTDAQGRAVVPVKVPDRLTTWRVLALAHAREGAQAGAVASFLGTLPTYVDPVLPPSLLAGDEVRLPVQVVNTTDAAVTTQLKLEAQGATLSAAGGPVKVGPFASEVQYTTLKTREAGQVSVKATLGDTDAIERGIDVLPAGRPESVSRGGTLGAPRKLTLEAPDKPLPGSERVRLLVYPGALALLRNELGAVLGRGGAAEDAYALGLAGRATGLLQLLGGEADPEALKDLTTLAAQRAYRHARTPDLWVATAFAQAANAHPENPVLQRLAERLALQVAQQQRPDGTCQGADGWTLQRLLVATADCVRAAKSGAGSRAGLQRSIAVSVKAAGAFERNLERIDDPYTAAAIVASGAVQGSLAERLRGLVKKAAKPDGDGGAHLPLEEGLQRADGLPPSDMEATALAVLALQGEKGPLLADLGAHLLGGYTPFYGWGDGRTNQLALDAVISLFKDKPPGEVQITLERDGQVVARGTLGADKLMEVLTLEASAAGSSGKHEWTVRAEPAVAGLGFGLTLSSYVAWKDEGGQGGLELQVEVPKELKVGRAAALALTAAAPTGEPVALRLSLPAGVQPDGPSLDALVSAGQVLRYETEDGAATLHLKPLDSGGTFQGTVKVVPTLAGSLQAPPSKLTPERRPQLARAFAPRTWKIAP